MQLNGPSNRDLSALDLVIVRRVCEAFGMAVDNMRDQAQHEAARMLGVPVERVREVWPENVSSS